MGAGANVADAGDAKVWRVKSRRRRTALLPLVVAAAFAAVACGPENEEAPPPRPPPTSTPPVASAPLPGLDEAVPTLRLPTDVHPLAESIELHLDPKQDRYTGRVDIDVHLDAPRALVWLHGKALHVTAATLAPDGAAPIAGTWAERHDSGVASVTLASVAPAGKARLHVEYDAA